MAIIDLQKRLRQIGTVRYGELVSRNGKTFPSTRATWRATTSDEMVARQVAELFGGTVTDWDSKSAERFVVDTDTNRLPIAVVPGHALSQFYELWSGGGCKRRCDGVDEMISGGACVCDPEQRECKPTTRFSFVLRGIDALGLFRLNTTGYYAAVELAGAVEFLEVATARGEVLPGWLRIEERRVVRDAQTKVFKVPVLDVAYGIDRMLPSAAPKQAAELSYTPAPQRELVAVTVEEGLASAKASGTPRATSGRSAAPIPVVDDVEFGEAVPVEESSPVRQPNGSTVETVKAGGGTVTQAQAKKLNVLVGKLRDAEQITTEHLYRSLAKSRNVAFETMVDLIADAQDEEGLHWGPLRDSLTKTEATDLIDRLSKLEQNTAAAAA